MPGDWDCELLTELCTSVWPSMIQSYAAHLLNTKWIWRACASAGVGGRVARSVCHFTNAASKCACKGKHAEFVSLIQVLIVLLQVMNQASSARTYSFYCLQRKCS